MIGQTQFIVGGGQSHDRDLSPCISRHSYHDMTASNHGPPTIIFHLAHSATLTIHCIVGDDVKSWSETMINTMSQRVRGKPGPLFSSLTMSGGPSNAGSGVGSGISASGCQVVAEASALINPGDCVGVQGNNLRLNYVRKFLADVCCKYFPEAVLKGS